LPLIGPVVHDEGPAFYTHASAVSEQLAGVALLVARDSCARVKDECATIHLDKRSGSVPVMALKGDVLQSERYA
jgi:hypothetical protein